MDWFEIENIDEIDSPSLVLYEDRLDYNIQKMLDMVKGNTDQLMPHVKTSKMPAVIRRMVSRGITSFKASTIAEAEITARVGVRNVLIAHQLVGPKITRFLALIDRFPKTKFATLLDNMESAEHLNHLANKRNRVIDFYIDINSGMNRSGISLGFELDEFLTKIPEYKSLAFRGLHVYDGHIRQPDFNLRKSKVEEEFDAVYTLASRLKAEYSNLKLICGGTPTFTSHLSENERICSPGTCVLWDWGYGDKLKEQVFEYACIVVTRVISKPTQGIVTIDLGHKSVASENPIQNRVKFLNISDYELLSQSEEHGILRVKHWDNFKVGDVLYGVPYHICPTINLHDEVSVIRNQRKMDTWEISARKRQIEI